MPTLSISVLEIKEIYTFISDEGEQICIDSPALRGWCLQNTSLEIVQAPMDREFANRIVFIDKAVDLTRVASLTEEELKEPVIFCKYGETNGLPDVMLVDGHHRYVRLAIDGKTSLLAYLLDESQWRPFQVHNVEKVTKEELAQSPVFKLGRDK